MLILAVMGAALVSLVTTGSDISVNQLQSEQALNVAEGGKEFILANRTFPNYSQVTPITLGAGSFTVATPAYLTVAVAIGNNIITVNSTSGFPAAGRIVIDSEVMIYTAIGGNTFTVPAGASAAHTNGNAVYPVTTVTADPGAGGITITVASTTGFVVPGVVRIDSEYIYCASTNTPLTTQFTNCIRGYKGSTAAAHIATSNVFQYIITTTSTVGTGTNSTRVIRTAVYGSAGGSGGGGGGINIRQGSFIKNTVVGAQSVTGVGFQSKAVIFFWTRQTAVGFLAMQSMGAGFATSAANQRAVAIAENDNAVSSNAGRRKSEANVIIMLSNGTPTMSANAALTSFDVDGFTINWLSNEVRQDIIHYIAIGGSDITNATAGTFNSNVAIGNQPVAGLGFQPDFVMFLTGSTGANDTNLSNSQLSLGFAKSSAARGAIVTGSQDARASNLRKRSQQRTNACILLLTLPDVRTQDGIADFVSMDANGFTINWSDAPAVATPIFYLALKGGQYNVGSFNQAIALGDQSVAGVGFQPVGLMMASFNKIAQLGIIADDEMSIGAAQSSTARGSIWSEVQDGVDPSESNSYTNTSFAMTMATGPAAVNAQTNFVAFNNDGFILNWTTVNATARQILYWVVGPTAQSTIPIATTHEEVY